MSSAKAGITLTAARSNEKNNLTASSMRWPDRRTDHVGGALLTCGHLGASQALKDHLLPAEEAAWPALPSACDSIAGGVKANRTCTVLGSAAAGGLPGGGGPGGAGSVPETVANPLTRSMSA